jgi:hypothetical protein
LCLAVGPDDEFAQKFVIETVESAPIVCEGPARMPEAEGHALARQAPTWPPARNNSAEKSAMNASNIQRAIQAHTVRLLGETAKTYWKRDPRKASIHAG